MSSAQPLAFLYMNNDTLGYTVMNGTHYDGRRNVISPFPFRYASRTCASLITTQKFESLAAVSFSRQERFRFHVPRQRLLHPPARLGPHPPRAHAALAPLRPHRQRPQSHRRLHLQQ